LQSESKIKQHDWCYQGWNLREVMFVNSYCCFCTDILHTTFIYFWGLEIFSPYLVSFILDSFYIQKQWLFDNVKHLQNTPEQWREYDGKKLWKLWRSVQHMTIMNKINNLEKFYRVLIMVYNTQNYWVFGLCTSFSILKTRKHNIF
jgi:hypothetical protein